MTARKSRAAAHPRSTGKRKKTAAGTAAKTAVKRAGTRSEATVAKLAKLGIRGTLDLVLHLPLRYEDETKLQTIAQLVPGGNAHVVAEVTSAEIQYRPRRQLVAQVSDGTGTLYLRFFSFYPSQLKQLVVGAKLRILGEVRTGFFGDELVHPRYTMMYEDAITLPDRLTPVYPTTAGLSQAVLRKLIGQALTRADLSDTLDAATRASLHLAEFASSVRFLHAPPPGEPLLPLQERRHAAWQRLKFDELLAQQLSMREARRARAQLRAPRMNDADQLAQRLLVALPFALTAAQLRCASEIANDLRQAQPMRRLLQGDVGSGKTVVAALACAQAIGAGYQAALMAPTEILAEQHFLKITALLAPLGIETAWLTGSMKKKDKQSALQRVQSGEAQLIVGTHALFQQEVGFAKLGLAVIDEQHRFGVAQRLALHRKGKDERLEPHQLMMSATPIPRTLSMSYFADLDVSVIDELPPGRTPIATKLVSAARRDEVVERVRAACQQGAQAYWVCPLIEESEALQLQTALDTYAAIQQTFPDLRVGLIHGRLPAAEKAAIMAAYQRGEIELLVATTVIEVGVDVPNASLMVIENAERMGLAQLHQLRGRVGRGSAQSVCILLFQKPLSETARARLKIIYENNDGFEIARQDLHLRGPGEFLGARQSGTPLLRFADLERDVDLLESASNLAEHLLEHSPDIAARHIERWMSTRQEFLKA